MEINPSDAIDSYSNLLDGYLYILTRNDVPKYYYLVRYAGQTPDKYLLFLNLGIIVNGMVERDYSGAGRKQYTEYDFNNTNSSSGYKVFPSDSLNFQLGDIPEVDKWDGGRKSMRKSKRRGSKRRGSKRLGSKRRKSMRNSKRR